MTHVFPPPCQRNLLHSFSDKHCALALPLESANRGLVDVDEQGSFARWDLRHDISIPAMHGGGLGNISPLHNQPQQSGLGALALKTGALCGSMLGAAVASKNRSNLARPPATQMTWISAPWEASLVAPPRPNAGQILVRNADPHPRPF